MPKKRLIVMLLAGLASQAHADLLGVEDLALLEQVKEQLQTMQRMHDSLQEQMKKLDAQKRTLEDTQKLMTGHYNYGEMLDNATLNNWRHSAANWNDLTHLGEGNGSDPLSTLAKSLQKDFPQQKGQSLYSNSEMARLFDQLSQTTLAARATNTLTYNNIDEELLMLEALQKEIEKSPNQKATLDLIARIQLEDAKLHAYQIKTSAVKNQLDSLQSQQQLTDTQWANDFFKLH